MRAQERVTVDIPEARQGPFGPPNSCYRLSDHDEMTASSKQEARNRPAKRILCFVREPHLDNMPCLTSLLGFLAEEGYELVVLCTTDPRFLAAMSASPRIQYHAVADRAAILGFKFRIPRTVALAVSGIRECLKRRPALILSRGSFGGLAAFVVSLLFHVRRVYHPLELPQVNSYESSPGLPDGTVEKLRLADFAERLAIRSADLVIAHDHDRADFIAAAAKVSRSKIEILPNAPRGVGPRHKTRWLAEALGIPAGTRIVLHFGGVGPNFDLVRLVTGVESWPEGWCLVIHSSFKAGGDEYLARLQACATGKRVFFSLKPVSSAVADELVVSADVGVATYSLKDAGYRVALMGLASGKIARYLRCGLPVVASDVSTVRKYIEQYDCGFCFDDPASVGTLLPRISNRYGELSQNAVRCFEGLFSPDPYCRKIADRLAAP
jgi:glycosyltransferase involved in cell wall biosynthesis